MPELPEVETIKNDLKQLIIGKKIAGIISEFSDIVKMDFEDFKKEVIGTTIIDVKRRAKSLIIQLSGEKNLLIHFKMSGHVIVTDENREVSSGTWLKRDGQFADPQNQFVRIQFFLNNSKQIAFSDLRRFGYIKLVGNGELDKFLDEYGPEPLEKSFSLGFLADILQSKKGPIKKILMDQKNIAGIGNIYADEILFNAKIHPQKPTNSLTSEQVAILFESIQKILKLALKNRGTSTSDYRDAGGQKGNYGNIRKVYRKTGGACPDKCGGKVERISLGGRGTHFCPSCQKL